MQPRRPSLPSSCTKFHRGPSEAAIGTERDTLLPSLASIWRAHGHLRSPRRAVGTHPGLAATAPTPAPLARPQTAGRPRTAPGLDSAGEFRLLVGAGSAGRVGRSSFRSL